MPTIEFSRIDDPWVYGYRCILHALEVEVWRAYSGEWAVSVTSEGEVMPMRERLPVALHDEYMTASPMAYPQAMAFARKVVRYFRGDD